MLEAKELLNRLLCFQVGDHFPLYLHEYPRCRYLGLRAAIYPVVWFILRDFSAILEDDLKNRLQRLLLHPPEARIPTLCKTPSDWGEFFVDAQTRPEVSISPFQYWDPKALCFMGPQQYEGNQPAVTLYDLFLGEWGGTYPLRATLDHPAQLRGSLVYPWNSSSPPKNCVPSSHSFQYLFWGNGNPTYSMVLETQGVIRDEGVYLPEREVEEEVEFAYFCSLPNEILVEEKAATTFQIGQTLRIGTHFKLRCTIEGGGTYWGHLYLGNRSTQLRKTPETAYDRVIAIRTVHRRSSAVIKVALWSDPI